MPDDAQQEFKILITSTADNTGFKEATSGAADLNKEMGVINVTHEDVEKATRKTSEAVEEGTEKFSESRRETREAANELGKLFGVHELGTAAMGKTGAAIVGMGLSLEFLKYTWEQVQSTINGPLNIELPPDAPAHISAAAEAWNQYAEARRKVIAAGNSPDAIESAAEKSLAHELALIKEVLAAEKDKALKELELRKDTLSPDDYADAKSRINTAFGDAQSDAEKRERQQVIARKTEEATNLETDAKNKQAEADAIKVAPKNVAEVNQKGLDATAADAEKALKELEERLALINRVEQKHKGNRAPEYEGAAGQILSRKEEYDFAARYGYGANPEEARKLEEDRITQAQAEIARAANYRAQQDQAKTKTDLETQAGTEAGRAVVLRKQIAADQSADAATDAVTGAVSGTKASTQGTDLAGAQAALAADQAAVRDMTAQVHQMAQAHSAALPSFSAALASMVEVTRAEAAKVAALQRQVEEMARGGAR